MRQQLISRELLDSFRRSVALQRLANDCVRLGKGIKAEPRKIVSVARMARMLEISNRLLWKWVDQGWVNTYNRPSEYHRKGISKSAFSRFLGRLVQCQAMTEGLCTPIPRGRPPAARNKMREAYHQTHVITDGMTAPECAAVLGISSDSALRALKGHLRSSNPTPCRYRLGERRKTPRAKRKRG